jgi:hypothetical protein
MLPQFRTYVLVNNSGQTLTYASNGRINVKETAIYFNTTDGKIVYVQLADDDLGFTTGTLADGAEIVGDVEVDNTSLLYISSQIQFEITHDAGAAADGTFTLYVSSGDATGELETDATGYASAEANGLQPVGTLVWEASAADDDVMRSQKFTLG